jgi:hypothetical protein
MHLDMFPPLIRFVVKWTAIGVAAGLLTLAALLHADAGGLGQLIQRSQSPWIALYILGLSFGGLGGPVVLAIAVLLRRDFGGEGARNSRLERWKAGGSAEIEEDRPS